MYVRSSERGSWRPRVRRSGGERREADKGCINTFLCGVGPLGNFETLCRTQLKTDRPRRKEAGIFTCQFSSFID